MMKRVMAIVLMLVVLASPASAQLNLPYTSFQPGQTISSAQFTANFTAISANALNRTGGSTTGEIDFNAKVDINSTFEIGSDNVQPFNAAGYLLETAIFDGSVLARVAANETYSGSNTFTGTNTFSGAGTSLTIFGNTSATTNSKYWGTYVNGLTYNLVTLTDALGSGSTGLSFTRSGTTITQATLTGTNITLAGAVSTSSSLAVTTNMSVGGDASISGTLYVGSFATDDIRAVSDSSALFNYDDISDSWTISNGSGESLYVGAFNTVAMEVGSGIMYWNGAELYGGASGYYFGTNSSRAMTIFLLTAPNVSSDIRLKQDIRGSELGIDFIDALAPKQYRLIASPNDVHYGFIAQDLLKLGFAGVTVDKKGMMGLRYEELIAPIVKGLQDVHKEVHLLDDGTTKRDNELKNEIELLKERVKQLELMAGKRVE